MINSFLTMTLLDFPNEKARESIKEDSHCMKANIRNTNKNISLVSLLYQYTNPPPLAYGSPAPKVAESILRTKEYNSLENSGRDHLGNKNRDRQYWTNKDGKFPMSITKPTSNIHLPTMREYSIDFCKLYCNEIDTCAKSLIEKIRTENADVLTKGRQTWDPFLQRSVTSPDAFKNMIEFFEKNLNQSNFTILEWVCAWSNLFSKEYIWKRNIKEEIGKKKIYSKIRRGFFYSEKIKRRIVWERVYGEEAKEYLLMIATEFCSYLKSKERSKLKRRAIASANMILRMFFDIIERFHLELGKVIVGSTISKGGIEKKEKIMEGLSTLQTADYKILATEDATKWNECLSPAGFYIMHHCFFNTEIRRENKIKMLLQEDEYELLEEIFSTGIYLLSQKRVFIGQGHVMDNGEFFTRKRWHGINPEMLNNKTKKWYLQVVNDLDKRDCIYSPFGMLMGMLNAASTTYGLLPTIAMRRKLVTIRSSDDSITLTTASSRNAAWRNLVEYYDRLRKIGINISSKKTRFFRWPFGEYTSWYIDGDFSSQYGVELSTIRPKGDTPHTDFHSSAIETNVALREFRVNNIGAEMMLALKIANTRRVWRIEKNSFPRKNINSQLQLLADGGPNPWHSTYTHLSEISLKKARALTVNEREYFQKVTNINNPFSSGEVEKMSYSKEMGRIINMGMDIPRNIFTYVKRPNKTLKSTYKHKEKAEMEAASFIIGMCERIEPAMAISNPNRNIACYQFMHRSLLQMRDTALSMEDKDDLHEICNVAVSTFEDIFSTKIDDDDNIDYI